MTKPDGTAAVGLNRDGVVDHTLTVVRLDGNDDRPVATIVHYACHPIILGPDNRYVTPEYPGVVKRVVEEAVGGHCLFVQGACGDVGPSELFVPDLAVYRRLGAMIGHEAAATALRSSWRAHRQRLREGEASAWIASFEYEPDGSRPAPSPSHARSYRFPSATISATPRRGGRRRSGGRKRRTRREPGRTRGRGARADRADEVRPDARRAGRGARGDGRLSFARPRRPPRAGRPSRRPDRALLRDRLSIRDASPFGTTLVSGYWNGYRNYLPTDAERARGGYEIDISPFRPGADALVTATAGRVLEALA